jgi:hypothetical protein
MPAVVDMARDPVSHVTDGILGSVNRVINDPSDPAAVPQTPDQGR